MAYILTAFGGVIFGAGIATGCLYIGWHFGWWSAKGSNPTRSFRQYKSGVPD